MRPSTRIGRTCFLAVQILVILVILCPILYALDISFLPLSQIFGKPLKLIPHEPDLSYYVTAFQRAPVSYTHLDVYKRQVWACAGFSRECGSMPFFLPA